MNDDRLKKLEDFIDFQKLKMEELLRRIDRFEIKLEIEDEEEEEEEKLCN